RRARAGRPRRARRGPPAACGHCGRWARRPRRGMDGCRLRSFGGPSRLGFGAGGTRVKCAAMPNVNTAAAAALPPHPELSTYYRGARAKTAFLRQIFDDTAQDYDRVEGLLALGSGRWYRRQALRRAGLQTGMRVLDVATGTGLVA